MGRRGPAPTPTNLRLLKGDRKDRINTREPMAPSAPPEAPEGIADDVREIWDYNVRELTAMGIASSADRDALLVLCEAIASHRKACAILKRSGVLIKGADGRLIRNPALVVQRDSGHTIRALCQLFGLTPSGRSTIQMEGRSGGEQSRNPFAASS